jgi:subtilisin family serine protease
MGLPVSVRLRDYDGTSFVHGSDAARADAMNRLRSFGTAFGQPADLTPRTDGGARAAGRSAKEFFSVSFDLADDGEADRLQSLLGSFPNLEVVADPYISAADTWTRYAPGAAIFGERRHGLRLIGAGAEGSDLTLGRGVHVVILDIGVNREWLKAHRKRCYPDLGEMNGDRDHLGGWSRYKRVPGASTDWFDPGDGPRGGGGHAHMIARNILSVAPAATIWDVPLLADELPGPSQISVAEALCYNIYRDITRGYKPGASDEWGNRVGLPEGPWILVNAWSVLDPMRVWGGFGRRWRSYFADANHYFIKDMARLSRHGIDVVFAAGNCGAPSAMPRCSEAATGAGLSIHGVNAHACVLTVGAVRVDGVPMGHSAQGPGTLTTSHAGCADREDDFYNKPDICAPSHFREDGDGYTTNTGTSAACGIAAGMLAALRSVEVAGKRRSPPEMRKLLREAASHPYRGWHPRYGWGIPNLAKALSAARIAPVNPTPP